MDIHIPPMNTRVTNLMTISEPGQQNNRAVWEVGLPN